MVFLRRGAVLRSPGGGDRLLEQGSDDGTEALVRMAGEVVRRAQASLLSTSTRLVPHTKGYQTPC